MTAWLKSRVAAIAFALVTAVACRALADEGMPPPSLGSFGQRGQVAVSGDLLFNILRQSANGSHVTVYAIQPALDYFVAPNVSLGGLVGFEKVSSGSSTASTTIIAIGGFAGYNLVLSSAASIWIRVGLEYVHSDNSFTGGSVTGYRVPVAITAPILWHPAAHFFIGAGPLLQTDLISKVQGQSAAKTTDVGVGSIVGGYFGGP